MVESVLLGIIVQALDIFQLKPSPDAGRETYEHAMRGGLLSTMLTDLALECTNRQWVCEVGVHAVAEVARGLDTQVAKVKAIGTPRVCIALHTTGRMRSNPGSRTHGSLEFVTQHTFLGDGGDRTLGIDVRWITQVFHDAPRFTYAVGHDIESKSARGTRTHETHEFSGDGKTLKRASTTTLGHGEPFNGGRLVVAPKGTIGQT